MEMGYRYIRAGWTIWLFLVFLLTKDATCQQPGGRNVCGEYTAEVYTTKESYDTDCGWELIPFKCTEYRYVQKFRTSDVTECCNGWETVTTGSKDCDIAICFQRFGKDRGTCQNSGKCISPDMCQCKEGYELPECTDIDECSTEDNGCDYMCVNTDGSYTCQCPDGFGLLTDQRTCRPSCYDIKPVGKCLNDQICKFTDICECADGLVQPKCEDVDECLTTPCDQVCVNTPGTFSCACEEGFILRQDNRTCEPHCYDVPGGVCLHGGECVKPGVCQCTEGFEPPNCLDIDECAEAAICSQQCINVIGSYTCSCEAGYTLGDDGQTCHDIDECKVRNGGCSHICANSAGSHNCQCPSGLKISADGETCLARCNSTWNLGTCPNGGSCLETGTCKCLEGFGGPECDNIDECAVSNGGCSHGCQDTIGSFVCTCPDGYVLKDKINCEDVDECESTHGCSGRCFNTLGTYVCQCKAGLVLSNDDRNCTDVDECALGTSDCSQVCDNSHGSYTCRCEEGFTLSLDDKTCYKTTFCQYEGQTGCWPRCKVGSDGDCQCPEGMRLHVDGRHCADPCISVPCQHAGVCKPDRNKGFKCDCTGTGYSGRVCQFGSVKIPEVFEVDKDYTYNNLTIWVSSDKDTVIQAIIGDSNVKVFPNPVIIWGSEDKVSLSLRAEEAGLFSVKFKITNPQVRKKQYTMQIKSWDVYARRNILLQTLPKGCFYLKAATDYDFSSTRPWYRLKIDDKTYFTFGVAYYIVVRSSVPLSIDGVQVTVGSNAHIGPVGSSRKASHGIRHTDSRDVDCHELVLTSTEQSQLMDGRSLLRSLFQATRKYAPYWLDLALVPYKKDTKTIPHYYETKFLTSDMLRTEMRCQGGFIQEGRMYLVALFTDGFVFHAAGQTFYLHDIDSIEKDKPYCFAMDFMYTNTLMIVLNTDTSQILREIPVTYQLLTNFDMRITSRGVSFSDSHDYLSQYDQNYNFYNGAGHFEYLVPKKVTVMLSVDVHKKFIVGHNEDFTIDLKTKGYTEFDPERGIVQWLVYPYQYNGSGGAVYLPSVSRLNETALDKRAVEICLAPRRHIACTIFTHVYNNKSNFLIFFDKLQAVVRLNILGIKHTIYVGDNDRMGRAIIGIGRNSERTECGVMADPPGISAWSRVTAHFSENLDEYNFASLTFAGEFYFFLTFKDKKDLHNGWNVDTLSSHIATFERRTGKLNKFLYLMKRSRVAKWKKDVLVDMIGTTETLMGIPGSFNIDNLTLHEASDLSHSLLQQVMALGYQVSLFESHLKISFDPQPETYTKALHKAYNLVKTQTKSIWWILFEGSLPYYPGDNVMGVKANINLKLLFWQLGVDAELIVSSEELMRCSDLYKYYDHIMPDPGGKIYRLAGSVYSSQVYMFESQYRSLHSLLNILTVEAGVGIEAAFADSRPLFAVKLHVKFHLFSSRVIGSLFIANDEVAGVVHLVILRLFRVRLTLGFAIPKQTYDLAIWLNGEFLAGDETAFNASLMFWTQRVLTIIKRDTQNKLNFAKDALKNRKYDALSFEKKLEKLLMDVDTKQSDFDRAIEHLEVAQTDLEKAKTSFYAALETLSVKQKNVQEICSVTNCEFECLAVLRNNPCGDTQRPCVEKQVCTAKVSQIKCRLQSFACSVVNSMAFAALEGAKGIVHGAMEVLNMSKYVVSIAQILVDKARFLLDSAKHLYFVTAKSSQIARRILSLAIKGVDYLKVSTEWVFEVFDSVIANTLSRFLDFRQCGFNVKISSKNPFIVQAYCEVNLRLRGWEMQHFTINFNDIAGTLSGFVKACIKKVKNSFGRVKRAVKNGDVLVSKVTHDSHLEYISWDVRCKQYKVIVHFLNTSVGVLRNISKGIIDEADDASREIIANQQQQEALRKHNLTPQDLNVDLEAAWKEYNISRDQIEHALRVARIDGDEFVSATKDFVQTIHDSNLKQIEYLRETSAQNLWLANVDISNYSGECSDFQDCVQWSFGELSLLLGSLKPDLATRFMDRLMILRDTFKDMMLNKSKTIKETSAIDPDFSVLDDLLTVFCGTLPVIIQPHQNMTVQIGHAAQFRCIAEGDPPPTYYWFIGESLILYGKDVTVLNLQNVTLADEGVYVCTAGNHIGNVSTEARLDVGYTPMVTIELPSVFHLHPAEARRPKAVVDAKPSAAISWVVCSSERCHQSYKKDFPISLKSPKSTQYICKYKASNLHGNVDSREMAVFVYDVKAAAPVKSLRFAYTYSLVDEDGFDGFDFSSVTNNVSVAILFQHEISKTFIGPDCSLTLDVISVDTSDRLATILIQPKADVLNHVGNVVDTIDSTIEKILSEINTTVSNLTEAIWAGNSIMNDTDIIFRYRQADGIRVEPTKFHCTDKRRFKAPHYCLQRPPSLQLASPQRIRSTRWTDHLRLKWREPFYARYLVQEYSIRIVSQDGSDVHVNTSSAEPSFSLPVSLCGEVCGVHVSALTASRRSKWTSRMVRSDVSDEEEDKGRHYKAGLRFEFRATSVIPIVTISAALVLFASFALVSSHRQRTMSKVVVSDKFVTALGTSSPECSHSRTESRRQDEIRRCHESRRQEESRRKDRSTRQNGSTQQKESTRQNESRQKNNYKSRDESRRQEEGRLQDKNVRSIP